jgi:hypothetical protein
MKKSLLVLLAAAGALSTMKAAPSSASTGDVILAFEDTSLNKNYVVNLGAGTSLSSFSSINIGTDLASVFGGTWNSDTNLFYGIFGVAADKSHVWASTLSGNNALPYKSKGALANALTYYNTLINNYNAELTYQGLTNGVYFNVGSGLDQGRATWSGNFPKANGTSAFGTYNQSLEGAVSQNDTLDVYDLGNTAGSVNLIFGAANGNQIQVTSAGVVQAVPEPSTYALLGLGALLLVLAARRRA